MCPEHSVSYLSITTQRVPIGGPFSFSALDNMGLRPVLATLVGANSRVRSEERSDDSRLAQRAAISPGAPNKKRSLYETLFALGEFGGLDENLCSTNREAIGDETLSVESILPHTWLTLTTSRYCQPARFHSHSHRFLTRLATTSSRWPKLRPRSVSIH